MIRLATENDKDFVLERVREFAEESLTYYGLTFSDKSIEELFFRLLKIGIILISDYGLIAGYVSNSFFDKTQLIGYEMIWFVKKEKRAGLDSIRLFNRFEKECHNRGATKIVMVNMANTNDSKMNSFYNKKEYTKMENHYIKDIS